MYFCPYPSNLKHINFQNILHPIHFAKHAKNEVTKNVKRCASSHTSKKSSEAQRGRMIKLGNERRS